MMFKYKSLSAPILLALGMTALPAPAKAVTTFTNLAGWQAAAGGSYARDTHYGTNLANISALTLIDGSALAFTAPVSIRTVGAGWPSWSGGYTFQVLFSRTLNSISATFSTPVDGFGFFAQPEANGTNPFTLSLIGGPSVSASYSAPAGAGFVGWVGTGISGFTVSSTSPFAIGDLYSLAGGSLIAVPEPSTWALLVAGFVLVGAAARRRTSPKIMLA